MQYLQSIASTSAIPAIITSSALAPFPSAASFHTSTTVLEKKRKLKARLTKKANIARREAAKEQLAASSPDPVRGYGPNNEQIWLDSPLYKLLLRSEKVWAGTEEKLIKSGSVRNPKSLTASAESSEGSGTAASSTNSPNAKPVQLAPDGERELVPNFGLSRNALDILLRQVPSAQAAVSLSAAELRLLQEGPEMTRDDLSAKHNLQDYEEAVAKFEAQRLTAAEQGDRMRRILDLKNANSRGIRAENTRRIIQRFSHGHGSGDSEVQGESAMQAEFKIHKSSCADLLASAAAILTMRIHNCADHLQEMPRDVAVKFRLRALVMARKRVLEYLKNKNLGRYVACLRTIGVDQRAVEGEIIVR